MRILGIKKVRYFASAACLLGLAATFVPVAFAKEDSFLQIEKRKAGESADTANMVVRATGVGYESPRHPAPQARLMARRAAVVDGYRKLAAMRGKVMHSLTGKTYYESVNGFIKGATVVETRYYYDGRVEVDMELPVNITRKEGGVATYDNLKNVLREHDVAVVEVEPTRREITKEEWEELFKKREMQRIEEKEAVRPEQERY